jgi:hypothetical protein
MHYLYFTTPWHSSMPLMVLKVSINQWIQQVVLAMFWLQCTYNTTSFQDFEKF